MKTIISSQNKRFKEWKKILTRKGREKEGLYLLEGPHLVEEALKEEGIIRTILVDETVYASDLQFSGEWIGLPHDLFMELAQTETPQGVIAVASIQDHSYSPDPDNGRYLLIDGVQDPGNLGTMIRTADAFGLQGVFLGKGTVDLYNQKVLRSAQGSHLHLPVYHGILEDIINDMKTNNIPVYGTSLSGTALDTYTSKQKSFALLMGNEGSGVHQDLNDAADVQLKIPMSGRAESMNVAVATGILMYILQKPLA